MALDPANGPGERLECVLVIEGSDSLSTFVRACLRRRWPQARIETYLTACGIPQKEFDWGPYQLAFIEHTATAEGATGLDWVREIKRHCRGLPLVMLAANGSEEVAAQALKLGARDCLDLDDVSPRRLGECVSQILTGHSGTAVDSTSDSGRETTRSASSKTGESVRLPATTFSGQGGSNLSRDPKIPGYSILRPVANGGMASITLARRAEDGRQVILKVLNLHGDPDGELLRRFMREYELIGKLDHPHVVRIYERGFAADFAYIAMEYLPAGDLKSRMTGPIPPPVAFDYLRQTAEGLGAVHELGIVHRDLKPSNVLFKDEKTLAIADFGIAKDLTNIHVLTLPGAVLGTPYYASPEQLLDQPLDRRSDLYSLGVMLYQMLTARRPFEGSSMAAVVYAHTSLSVPPLPAGLEAYQPVVDGLLAKDPDERFQTAQELLAGLEWA